MLKLGAFNKKWLDHYRYVYQFYEFRFLRHSSLLDSQFPVLMGKLTEVKIITSLCVIIGAKKG